MGMILKTIKKGGDVPPSMCLICSFTQNRNQQDSLHNYSNTLLLYIHLPNCAAHKILQPKY